MPGVQAEAPIADVCLQLAQSWPNKKSAMMATMMEVLDEEAVQAVMELDPWNQTAIAFAFMVTAPEEKAGWSTFVKQLVGRFLRLRGDHTQEPPASLGSPKQTSATISVQFVLGGFSTIVAGTLMSVMQNLIRRMHAQHTWKFEPIIFVRDGTADQIATTAVKNATRLDFDLHCSSCQKMNLVSYTKLF